MTVATDPAGKGTKKALLFLLPAALLLIVYVVYPLVFSSVRSLYDAKGDTFVGLGNYAEAFTDDRTLIALRNNAIWVLVAPTVVTALGLLFAVLTERVSWAAAFRLVLFMPMAISLFASGVIFRLVYEEDPQLGVANAAVVTVNDIFHEPSPYPGVRQRIGGAHVAKPGETVEFALAGMAAHALPETARLARLPEAHQGELRGTVWLDVAGEPGRLNGTERGMPGVAVEAKRDGEVVARTTTGDDGSFTFADLQAGDYAVGLPTENFRPPFRGLTWLGPGLVTPVIISAWTWIMTGFAMTFIAAGLSAISREALEAARVDGATEWQVFRKVTVPLLAPVLVVVFVTLVINALKIFELVYVVAPGSVQAEANVLALQMWQVSFGAGGNQGFGSALGVILFLLVLPAMVFNIRRFRKERSG